MKKFPIYDRKNKIWKVVDVVVRFMSKHSDRWLPWRIDDGWCTCNIPSLIHNYEYNLNEGYGWIENVVSKKCTYKCKKCGKKYAHEKNLKPLRLLVNLTKQKE